MLSKFSFDLKELQLLGFYTGLNSSLQNQRVRWELSKLYKHCICHISGQCGTKSTPSRLIELWLRWWTWIVGPSQKFGEFTRERKGRA